MKVQQMSDELEVLIICLNTQPKHSSW